MFKKTFLGMITIFSSFFAVNSYAVSSNGPYLGLQFGWGNVHQSSISRADMFALTNDIVFPDPFTLISFRNSSTTDGWAGRIFTGWQFDCHWAAEIGYTRFHTFEANAAIVTTDDITGEIVSIATSASGHTQAFDLVAKYMWPFCDRWNFYGKLGVAYLWNNIDASVVINNVEVNDGFGLVFSDNANQSHHKVYPTYGIGVSYDYHQQLVMDLSWNRIQRVGGDSNFGNTDLFAIGLAWHFNC